MCPSGNRGDLPKETKKSASVPHHVQTRPVSADGTFLRIVTINDVYRLDNYARFAAAVKVARSMSDELDCVVISTLNGDFLSPSTLTALDQGRGMLKGLNLAEVDYVCLGNHEFDLGFAGLEARLKEFKGTIINSNADGPQFLTAYPKWCTLSVGNRTAVIGGYLTEQIDIYPPNAKPTFRPINDACVSTWDDVKAKSNGVVPDLFLPMTHQLMPLDRQTGEFLAKHEELGTRTPIILGGHDHEVYIEEAGKSWVAKIGYDAQSIGVYDVWWTKEGELKFQISVIPCKEFPEDLNAASFAREKEKCLQSLMSTPIAALPKPGSTKKVRFEESFIASYLLSYVKRGLRDEGVDVAMIQAGAVRGLSDYKEGAFLMGDLFAEFAFETPLGVVNVPGNVIAESVHNTRSAPKPAPQFLHLDEDCTVVFENGKHEVTHLNGSPIVPDKMYRLCIWNNTLNGVNDIQPLLSYVQKNSLVPDDEACRRAKDVVIETCMRDAWRHVFGLEDVIRENDGICPYKEAMEAVNSRMKCLDKDGNGLIDTEELYEFMEKEGHKVYHGCGLAMEMLKVLDTETKGVVKTSDLVEFVNATGGLGCGEHRNTQPVLKPPSNEE